MKNIAMFLVVLVLLGGGSVMGQTGIVSLDSVVGLWNENSLDATAPETAFLFRLENNTGVVITGFTTGFRVYSEDGATWTTAQEDTLADLQRLYTFFAFETEMIPTGDGADSTGFNGISFSGGGMPDGYDTVAIAVRIGPLDIADHGKTICLDSSYYRPTGVWKWGSVGELDFFPEWSGRACFTVIDPNAAPILGASVSSVEFTVDGSQPEDQAFTILLSDESTDKTVDVSGALDTKAGGDLTFTPSSGTHGTEITVSLDATGLAIGDYTGTITLSSSETFNSTFEIGVDVGVTTPLSVRNLTDEDALPTTFALSQNYPNPFNPSTEIAFDLPTRTHVTLTVYNVLGQQVTTLVDKPLAAGSYVADWDGLSSGGAAAASGIYFYRIHTEQFTQTKKMVLLK